MKKINLEDLRKDKDLFEVPENYFDRLPSKIQDRIQYKIQQEKSQAAWYQVFTTKASVRIATSLCAVVFAFFVGTKFYSSPNTVKVSTEMNLSEVSEQDIHDYLLQTDIATDEIVQVCETQGTDVSLGLPIDISQEILEEELNIDNIDDYL
jgi:hypothetical protein